MRGIRIRSMVSGVMLAGLCTTLSAATIGTFNIAGNITVANAPLAPGGAAGPLFPGCSAPALRCISWTDSAGTTPNTADISAIGLSGIYATDPGFSGNDQALISDLADPPEIVGSPGFPATQFISFVQPGHAPLLINFIEQGFFPATQCSAAPAAGQVCTQPGSLFNFVNNPGGAAGAQATATWVLDGVTADGHLWSGNFTSQFTVPFQTVFANLGTRGFVSNTYSATFQVFDTTVPEPGPMTLTACGLGLVLFSAAIRRRSSRSH